MVPVDAVWSVCNHLATKKGNDRKACMWLGHSYYIVWHWNRGKTLAPECFLHLDSLSICTSFLHRYANQSKRRSKREAGHGESTMVCMGSCRFDYICRNNNCGTA